MPDKQISRIEHWAQHFESKFEGKKQDAYAMLDYSNLKFMQQVHHAIMNAIDYDKLIPGSCILDCGCGTGDFLMEMIKRTALSNSLHLTASDISKSMIETARTNFEKVIPTSRHFFEYAIMSVDGIGFNQGQFDLCIACEILQYVQPEKGISELVRVTKPGGQVLISAPNKNSIYIKKAEKKNDYRYQGIDILKVLQHLQTMIESIKIRPMIFAEDQTNGPYRESEFKKELSEKELLESNRFIINIIK